MTSNATPGMVLLKGVLSLLTRSEALMRAYVVRVLGSWNSPLFADLLTRQARGTYFPASGTFV